MLMLASDLKATWRQDLHVVKSDVTALQDRVPKLEASQAPVQKLLSTLQASSTAQESHQQTHQQYPFIKVFNSLLGKAVYSYIDIDKAH